MLTHMVLFNLKEPTAENIDALVEKFRSMVGKTPQIRSLETGANIMEGDRYFDVGLIVKLDDLDALNAYAVDPYHTEILAYAKAVVSESKAVDFLSE